MKIFIDFDDVLFNTKQFKADYLKLFKKRGVSRKIFEACYYDPLDDRGIKAYDAIGHIGRVGERVGIDLLTLEKEIVTFLADTNRYIFSDVVAVLKKFQKKELQILSFSLTNFQKAKIANSGIAHFFGKISIVDRLKGEAIVAIIKREQLVSQQGLYFIDDRTEQIESVKTMNAGVKTILCVRAEGRYRDRKNKYCDYKITQLKELEKIIKIHGK